MSALFEDAQASAPLLIIGRPVAAALRRPGVLHVHYARGKINKDRIGEVFGQPQALACAPYGWSPIFRERLLVGTRGFEPPTPASRTLCSTRLSHVPTSLQFIQKTGPGQEKIGIIWRRRLLRCTRRESTAAPGGQKSRDSASGKRLNLALADVCRLSAASVSRLVKNTLIVRIVILSEAKNLVFFKYLRPFAFGSG